MKQPSIYSRRLPESLKEAVSRFAEKEGISMNQFIVMAVAEKLSALSTASFFEEKVAKVDLPAFREILNRPNGESPRLGDEMP